MKTVLKIVQVIALAFVIHLSKYDISTIVAAAVLGMAAYIEGIIEEGGQNNGI